MTGFDEDDKQCVARPGCTDPGQKTEHRKKANDNVESLAQYRSNRMVKPSGSTRFNAPQLAAA